MQRGNSYTTSWIPNKFAKIGEFIKLKNNGIWEDGWKVIEAFTMRSRDALVDPRKAIKKHRERTGDSLPKKEDK